MKAQSTEIPVSGFKCSWKKPVQSQITSINLLKTNFKRTMVYEVILEE